MIQFDEYFSNGGASSESVQRWIFIQRPAHATTRIKHKTSAFVKKKSLAAENNWSFASQRDGTIWWRDNYDLAGALNSCVNRILLWPRATTNPGVPSLQRYCARWGGAVSTPMTILSPPLAMMSARLVINTMDVNTAFSIASIRLTYAPKDGRMRNGRPSQHTPDYMVWQTNRQNGWTTCSSSQWGGLHGWDYQHRLNSTLLHRWQFQLSTRPRSPQGRLGRSLLGHQ